MALTEATIRMNYQKAMQQAQRLEEIANDMQSLSSNDFGGTLQDIAASWKGENASEYLRKGGMLQGDMEETSRTLSDIAIEIRRKAKAIRDAEMAALQIATKRNY